MTRRSRATPARAALAVTLMTVIFVGVAVAGGLVWQRLQEADNAELTPSTIHVTTTPGGPSTSPTTMWLEVSGPVTVAANLLPEAGSPQQCAAVADSTAMIGLADQVLAAIGADPTAMDALVAAAADLDAAASQTGTSGAELDAAASSLLELHSAIAAGNLSEELLTAVQQTFEALDSDMRATCGFAL